MNCTNSPKHITSAVNKITATQIQFLLTINCGCTARTQNLELPTGSVHCSEYIKIDTSIKHLINLPYLAHFLIVDDFEVLSADVILNDSIPISVSQLPLASLEYKKLQTDEEEAKMDLEKAINSSKSSTKIYRSLSHYLYNKLLQAHDYTETFDVLNWWSWLSIFGMIAGFLALIGVGFLHFGTKSILLAVAYNAPRARALPTLPQSFDFGLQTTPITGANTHVFPDLRQIAELLPAGITLLLILILLVLAMVFYGIEDLSGITC